MTNRTTKHERSVVDRESDWSIILLQWLVKGYPYGIYLSSVFSGNILRCSMAMWNWENRFLLDRTSCIRLDFCSPLLLDVLLQPLLPLLTGKTTRDAIFYHSLHRLSAALRYSYNPSWGKLTLNSTVGVTWTPVSRFTYTASALRAHA